MPDNFLLHINLLGSSSPLIFRTLSVPYHATFHSFHHALQTSFGWKNKHLWRVTFQSPLPTPGRPYLPSGPLLRIEDQDMDDWEPYDERFARSIGASPGGPLEERDSHETKVGEVLMRNFGKGVDIIYEYDWFDCWVHKIELIERVAETLHLQVVEGKGHEPAEEGGGIRGWEKIKLAYQTQYYHLTSDQKKLRKWYETECINGGFSPSFGFSAKDWKRFVVNGRLEKTRLDM